MSEIDPSVVAAFGSETRVRALAVLASCPVPLTAYRIGKVGGIPFPKVYRELDRLAKKGLVTHSGRYWTLTDGALADYLRHRVPILWDEVLLSQVAQHHDRTDRIYELAKHVARPKLVQSAAPKRYARPASKDRLLREMGLRPSVHAESS